MKKTILTLCALSALSAFAYVSGPANDKLRSTGNGYRPAGKACSATFERGSHRATMQIHKSSVQPEFLRALRAKTNVRVSESGDYYQFVWTNLRPTGVKHDDVYGYQGFFKPDSYKYQDQNGNVYYGSFNTYMYQLKSNSRIVRIHIQHSYKCERRAPLGSWGSVYDNKPCRRALLDEQNDIACYVSYKLAQ